MLIEFQGDCSLEVAHIGTPEQIAIERLVDIARTAAEVFQAVGRKLVAWLQPAIDAAMEIARQIFAVPLPPAHALATHPGQAPGRPRNSPRALGRPRTPGIPG